MIATAKLWLLVYFEQKDFPACRVFLVEVIPAVKTPGLSLAYKNTDKLLNDCKKGGNPQSGNTVTDVHSFKFRFPFLTKTKLGFYCRSRDQRRPVESSQT